MVNNQHEYDILLCGGRVVDPENGIDEILDVAIRDGHIAAVAKGLDDTVAKQIHDVSGIMVVPGLIDLHTHFYHKATSYGVDPNPVAAQSVIATMVDAGSAGAGNFAGLRDYVITKSPFRLLTYINISYPGIFAFDRNYTVGEATIRELLSVEHCVEVARKNRNLIVGVKVRLGSATSGNIGMEALERAIEAAEKLDLPVMTHIGKPPPSYGQILARLRPADVLTHCFRPYPNAPVDDAGYVLADLVEARERGILFDIGHGMGAFGFASAEAALAEGFKPDIISSDIHALCQHGPAFDLLHTMSKLIRCGLSVREVVAMATQAPARAMRRPDLGHLSVGASADISLLDTVDANYPFEDVTGARMQSEFLLRPRGLYIAGQFIEPGTRDWESKWYIDQ
jgi:dihydroorotase